MTKVHQLHLIKTDALYRLGLSMGDSEAVRKSFSLPELLSHLDILS